MTIRLTLDLPAPASELHAFAEMAYEISPDLAIDVAAHEGIGTVALVATIGGIIIPDAPTVAESEPEPEPVKVPKADKPARKVNPSARVPDGGLGAVVKPGSAASTLLAHLVKIGGTFEGGAVDLASAAGAPEAASRRTATQLAAVGHITTTKAHARKITSITITDQGRRVAAGAIASTAPRHLEPVADPAPAPSPAHPTQRPAATPLPVPPGGIKEPAKGWA